MASSNASSAAPPELPQPPESVLGSTDQLPAQVSQPPLPSPESARSASGWKIIGEQQSFYNEQDCLHPSHNLASEKLKNRKEDDVVIFDYSLDPDYLQAVADDSRGEEGEPSSESFGVYCDMFFRVPKEELIRSEKFEQVINPSGGSRLPEPRLGIIDFPQCYDTYDEDLLNSMGEKLGLPKEGGTTLMAAYLQRLRTLPGDGRFSTGVFLRAPFKELSKVAKQGSSEDRFILFVSFPYFGKASQDIRLGPESESVKLLDFKGLGVDVPAPRASASNEERDNIGEILVHQARYMIFDNYTMATFRSKEDSPKDQAPLHRFQERVGAFRAMIHMIANRTASELWTLGKLQASLRNVERDIDQIILDAKMSEDDQEMERKQKRVRGLLTSFNSLSANLFAAISLAERQIAVLQDLHSVFFTSYRTKAKDYQKGYPLRGNPFYRNVIPIPILSENREQIWTNALDTIDEVVREREAFIKKVKGLVENMDIRRKIFSAFLKSEQTKAAPSEKTAQETAAAMKRTEQAIKETQAEIVQQGQTLSSFTLVTTAFLPLGFCTSYFGMQTVEGLFDKSGKITLRAFWLNTGPALAVVLLVVLIIVVWKRRSAKELRARLKKKFPWLSRKNKDDLERGRRHSSSVELVQMGGPN